MPNSNPQSSATLAQQFVDTYYPDFKTYSSTRPSCIDARLVLSVFVEAIIQNGYQPIKLVRADYVKWLKKYGIDKGDTARIEAATNVVKGNPERGNGYIFVCGNDRETGKQLWQLNPYIIEKINTHFGCKLPVENKIMFNEPKSLQPTKKRSRSEISNRGYPHSQNSTFFQSGSNAHKRRQSEEEPELPPHMKEFIKNNRKQAKLPNAMTKAHIDFYARELGYVPVDDFASLGSDMDYHKNELLNLNTQSPRHPRTFLFNILRQIRVEHQEDLTDYQRESTILNEILAIIETHKTDKSSCIDKLRVYIDSKSRSLAEQGSVDKIIQFIEQQADETKFGFTRECMREALHLSHIPTPR